MKVRIAEFYGAVTGTDPTYGSTKAKVNALNRWGIPMVPAGTGTGQRVHMAVDPIHLEAAKAAYAVEQDIARRRDEMKAQRGRVRSNVAPAPQAHDADDLIGTLALLHRKVDAILESFGIPVPE